jgi:hypothetical protein
MASSPPAEEREKTTLIHRQNAHCSNVEGADERKSKRQRTAALQDAVARDSTLLFPRGLGVRLSSAALIAAIRAFNFVRWPSCRSALELAFS